MRAVLGSVIVLTCLVFADAAFAQGGCSATCGRYNAECRRQLGVAAAQCQGAARGGSRLSAECDRRERAYASACSTRYNQCLRACGRR
jgi:hypothetical protein